MSYTEDIEKMRASIEKERDRKLAELDTRLEIAGYLDDLSFLGNVTFIHGQGFRCDGSIEIDAPTADIPAIMTAIPPIPAGKFSDGCTSFHCLERVTERDPQPITVAPFVVEVDKIENYPTRTTVTWWAKLGDLIVKVGVKVLDPSWVHLSEQVQRDHKGRIIQRYWTCRIDKGQDQVVKWSASAHGKANPFTFYWTDPDLAWGDL